MNTSFIAGITGVIATGAALRAINVIRAQRASARQGARPRNADGVIVGAEAFRLEGRGAGAILLLHGFNDTPQSVGNFARALNAHGWSVSVPLLSQHGRGSTALERTGSADAWIDVARREWAHVRSSSSRAVLAGQSMGGAIAVILASEHPPIGMVLLAPYLSMGWLGRTLSRVWPVWSLVTPELLSDPRKGIHDPAARRLSLGNGRFSPRLVRELAKVVDRSRRALPLVKCPTLVFHSRHDYRIPARAAADAFARLGSTDKELEWREQSGHVLAADSEHEAIAERAARWLERPHR